MTSSIPSIQRFGLSVVHNPPDALVDLVFVHGLNGNPERTWTSEHSKVFWPSQLLPQFVEDQRVRVLVYGYDADVTSLGGPGVTKDKIHNHAERLVADLFANRRIRKAKERPILFVAHSLGGLIVKRAMITSSEITGQKTEHLRSIYVSTYGILFLGTPHKGADVAQWGSYLETLCHAIMPKKALDTGSQLVDALKTNSETLLNIDRQFAQLLDQFHIFFFHEAKPTDMKGTLRFIVEEDSAAPTLPDVERAGIQADHQHMCKFEDETSPGFDLMMDGIQRYAEDAPAKIRGRWANEMIIQKQKASGKAMEQFGDLIGSERMNSGVVSDSSSVNNTPGSSTLDLANQQLLRRTRPSQTTSTDVLVPSNPEPYFIVPAGFRANTFFVGMDKEMKQLDQRLFDKRRKDGTASVVLHGPPGAGKTHLARQYIYQNRHKFTGGVFWICAMVKEEIYKDFWQIQQKVVAKVAPEFIAPFNGTDDMYVEVVKSWFESRSEWLIVLDGAVVDGDQDVQELHRFIPDSKNSSLIYISRNRRIENMQRLLHPSSIKVAPLKEEQGRKLLFKEIGIKRPRESQIRSADELSKRVGGLPLAITAIARRLADTHEPIEKFSLKSYSDDPKLGGTYKLVMEDLHRHNHSEALNLINLLCFFGPHIPVEMINLGMKALRKMQINIKAREMGGEEDLNVTFSILMRHALIERNDPDDSESMSSSHDSFVEPEPIDVLNMHAVIQKFCCDSLDAEGPNILQTWLMYAVQFFNQSFREANLRISNQPKPARLSDYRWYLVHGQKLYDHTHDYELKTRNLQYIRDELDPIIRQIHDEIRTREPSSSQESISQTEFQISIFDRTTSTSSSGHSETADRPIRPPPIPLPGENVFGMPISHHSSESPASLTSPNYPVPYSRNYAFSDDGEPLPLSYPMIKGWSDSTARPRSDSISYDDHSGWQLGSNKKGASFRPASAVIGLDRENAIGSISRPQIASGSSYAFSYLSDAYRKSPPPQRGGRSIWTPRRSRSKSPQPSYADVVSRQMDKSSERSRLSSSAPTQGAFPPPNKDSKRPRGRGLDPQSRHASKTAARQRLSPRRTGNYSPSSMSRESSGEMSRDANTLRDQYQRAGVGRNVAPLPYESNVTVQYPYSHQMSRDSSDHTAYSEPLLQSANLPPFAPPMGGTISASGSNNNLPISNASRGRRPDGSPINKSPKFNASAPLPPRAFDSPAHSNLPRNTSSNTLATTGIGEWANIPPNYQAQLAAIQSQPSHYQLPASAFPPPSSRPSSGRKIPSPVSTGAYPPPSIHSQVTADANSTAMSRNSSGPGFAIPTSHGLGIAPFGEHNAQLPFPAHETAHMTAAERNLIEWKRRMSLREKDGNVPFSHQNRHLRLGEDKVAYNGGTVGGHGYSPDEVRRGSDGYPTGHYNYSTVNQLRQAGMGHQQGVSGSGAPWGYASGFGPGSVRPNLNAWNQNATVHPDWTNPTNAGLQVGGNDGGGSPNMQGLEYEPITAPYPESDRIPTEAGSLAYQLLAEQRGRTRGNSAPESPSWRGTAFWGS